MLLALFQEIKSRQEDFMRAFNAGDAAKAAEIYDKDGYFMPNGHSPVKGRSGIESYFKKDMSEGVASAQVCALIFIFNRHT
jgi:ketosteroid isomerase-like protein